MPTSKMDIDIDVASNGGGSARPGGKRVKKLVGNPFTLSASSTTVQTATGKGSRGAYKTKGQTVMNEDEARLCSLGLLQKHHDCSHRSS